MSVRLLPEGQGEPFEVRIDSRDIFRWERTGKNNTYLSLVSGGFGMTQAYELAFLAARREKLLDPKMALDEFVEAYMVDMDHFEKEEEEEDEEEPDPTTPARTPAS